MNESFVCGVDEAGRGALVGAVVAAAVVLGGNSIAGLRDSKQLTAKRREELAARIREGKFVFCHRPIR